MKKDPISTVLFDLDGTLLPMNQEHFARHYFETLAKWLAPHGYDPEKLIGSMWKGISAMVQNDGTRTNETVFWNVMQRIYGDAILADLPVFEEYYRADFLRLREECGLEPQAVQIVRRLRESGIGVALATNPVFPFIATEARIRWAGLEPEDFAFYTSYENSSHCKPDPAYYTEVAARMGVLPERCLMVGNDTIDDTAAAEVGMKVFLVTDCLVDSKARGVGDFPNGSFSEMVKYLEQEVLA